MFLSAAVGLCALVAIIRAFSGEKTVGNFFLDMWRVVVYAFLPVALLLGVLFIHEGMPMTFKSAEQVSTLEPSAMGVDDARAREAADHHRRPGCGRHSH